MWVYGPDWADPGQRQVADACECGNEPSGSVKCGEFLDQLQTSQLLKKDSAPWSKWVYVTKNGEWKSWTNRGLEEMSKGEIIVKWVKGQRISWLGQLQTMEEDRMPKKIFTQELEGMRRR